MSSGITNITLNLSADEDDSDRSAIDLNELQKLADLALPMILKNPGPHESSLTELEEIDVILVSDQTIAQVHGEFLDDPTPTDVITFHHGEILVSTDTAAANAAEYRNSPARETLLYVVHGLLHLNGHHDAESVEREEMHRVQEGILEAVWATSNTN